MGQVGIRRPKISSSLADGGTHSPTTELQGLKLGPIAIPGCGFEVFQAIKNDIVAVARHPGTLVTGLTNRC